MIKNFRPAAIAAAAAAALASPVSQAALTSDTVTVTAARTEQDLMETPMSVAVIGAEEIRRSSAATIGKLLEDVPGVRITNDGSQGLIRVSLRGEDTFRTLVLIDGQKISEHKSMSGAPILIDPASVERIEVIRGPASVLYGSEAIGGVINVITKKGSAESFSAEVSAGWHGASDGLSGSASVSGSAHGFHYRLGGGYTSLSELKTPQGKAENSSTRQKNGSLYLAYDFTDRLTAGLTADTFDARINSGTLGQSSEEFFVKVPEWKRTKAGVFLEAHGLEGALTRLRGDFFRQKNDKRMQNHVTSSGAGSSVVMDAYADNRITTTGASLQADWELSPSNHLITGYEYSRDKLEADTQVAMDTRVAMGPMTMKMNSLTDRHNRGSQSSHAVFAQLTSELPADLTLNLGARYTYVETEMDQASAWKTGTMNGRPRWNLDDGSAGTEGRDHSDRVIFNAGLVWTGIDHLSLRGGWSQGFRAPILLEKYLMTSMGSTSSWVQGNPDLKPETSDTFELGARWSSERLTADASVYHSRARNYISQTPLGAGASAGYTYDNVASARTTGFEAQAEFKAAPWFRPYVSLALMQRKFHDSGRTTSKTGDPRFTARWGVKSTFAALSGALDTDLYARTASASDYESADGSARYRYGGYTTANASAGFSWGKDGAWRLDAELLNIFDKSYQYTGSILEPGRHFNLRFSGRF